ncbi:hypothetical protein CI102_8822 [Trichoderma harzianum]|uniref:CIDE-N domain-containing protein n=1 Tax=Trichoderma harzianum CBS 226.95 TaxID=983964 RepID=A0A2T3ZTN2_TRIHA|nr:hypothetical protein M431DRAFT_333002 [Trichoderma harzianum CBS 226.95]PKK46238.1 hypothetical protein CI102_8822 [Trichoderma harzianum]PTB48164.1 hypothetical protein M431DRAFT_333002 [Trichoderma harzianum CBS 226.95]
MLQEHVTLHQDEDFFSALGLDYVLVFMIPQESWAECWQATRRNLLAQAAILTLSCAVCFFFIFFLFPSFVVYCLAFKSFFSLFFCSHWHWEDFDGMGIPGWGGVVYDNPPFLSSALHVSAALFSILSCSLLSLTWSFICLSFYFLVCP